MHHIHNEYKAIILKKKKPTSLENEAGGSPYRGGLGGDSVQYRANDFQLEITFFYICMPFAYIFLKSCRQDNELYGNDTMILLQCVKS